MEPLTKKLIEDCLQSLNIINSSSDPLEKDSHKDHLKKMISLPNVLELFSEEEQNLLKKAIE